MFAWDGAAGQLYSCGCSPHDRRSCPVPCHGLSSTNIIKAKESRRLHVVLSLLEGPFNVYTVYCKF